MSVQLGDAAPNFTAQTTHGELDFYNYLGDSWGVLFSHPADFTPVCTTELGMVARLKPEFEKRNVKVMALSIDPLPDHYEWIKDINRTQNCEVDFPIIADVNKQVALKYGMLHPNASDKSTVRCVYIVGPDKKVKLTLTYPASTGRNFQEILRVIDSLQLSANHAVVTPADWQEGEDCVIAPSVRTADIAAKFPKGHTVLTDYLRMTPQPDK